MKTNDNRCAPTNQTKPIDKQIDNPCKILLLFALTNSSEYLTNFFHLPIFLANIYFPDFNHYFYKSINCLNFTLINKRRYIKI